MKLYIVRHGETEWNADERICGSTDLPLTSVGIDQAETLAFLMGEHPISRIFVSPLLRARQTAQILARRLDLTPQVDARLTEQSFGAFEGSSRYTGAFITAKGNFARRMPGGGESVFQLVHRVYSFIEDVREKCPGEHVLAVCHGAVARAVHSYFYDMGNEEYCNFFVGNCQLLEYLLNTGRQ